IDAYDIHQNLGTPLQKLKISDAITLCLHAWKEVTAETIKNCWLKTGILPTSEDTMQVDTDTNTEITDEEIISCVRPIIQTETEDDDDVPQTITTTEVLKSLDTVTSYIKNPPQNLVFELKHINSINVIKNQISRHEINSKKQTTLERWFT
ncbi:10629_t:CDS:2, partial [Entrophospora sp. SA101]